MELRQLEVFVTVAQERSFTRAAERLHVVQSAVSATIRALEAELDTPLLQRTTRAVGLSDAGAALLPEARAVLAAAALARDVVEQTKGGLRGAVRVGIMQGSAQLGVSIPELIVPFQRAHPDVELTVRHIGGSAEMADGVRAGIVDAAVLSLPGAAPGLELTELASEPILLACADDHPLARTASVTLSQIAGERFVDGPPPWGNRLAADRAFARADLTRTVDFEVNDVSTLVEFVHNGAGVALLPRSLTSGHAGIALVPIEGEPIPFRTLLAVSSERRLTAAVRAFVDSVRRTAAAG
jgi:DNA-binding transcriptional LysR family regulator